jgi:hypothetical protein
MRKSRLGLEGQFDMSVAPYGDKSDGNDGKDVPRKSAGRSQTKNESKD